MPLRLNLEWTLSVNSSMETERCITVSGDVSIRITTKLSTLSEVKHMLRVSIDREQTGSWNISRSLLLIRRRSSLIKRTSISSTLFTVIPRARRSSLLSTNGTCQASKNTGDQPPRLNPPWNRLTQLVISISISTWSHSSLTILSVPSSPNLARPNLLLGRTIAPCITRITTKLKELDTSRSYRMLILTWITVSLKTTMITWSPSTTEEGVVGFYQTHITQFYSWIFAFKLLLISNNQTNKLK